MYRTGVDSPARTIDDRAHASFDQGTALFEQDRHRDAATQFRNAAEILREGDDLPDPALLQRNRRIAYANMVLSLLDGDAVDTARTWLEEVATTDPPLADDLRATAARLPTPPACELDPPGSR